MPSTLIHVGRTPGQKQFGLDTFVEHYKCNDPADVVVGGTTVPDTQQGAVHPVYPFMFVTDRYCVETGPTSSALDVTYMGCIKSSGGLPALPSPQAEISNAVQSATSSRGRDGSILISPVTAEFYAPTRRLNFITYGAPGIQGSVPDPTGLIQVIKLTVGDTSYTPTGALGTVVDRFFTQQIVDTLTSTEVVAGKFWQNSEIKTRTYTAWIYTVTSGNYITMFAPGQGYTVGNTLTFTDGTSTAAVMVDSVGIGNSIVGFHQVANSFTYTTPSPLNASGGSGAGAAFYNYNIP